MGNWAGDEAWPRLYDVGCGLNSPDVCRIRLGQGMGENMVSPVRW